MMMAMTQAKIGRSMKNDRPRRHFAFGIHCHHELALGAALHRSLRHANRGVELRLREADANEGTRQEVPARVRELGAENYRAAVRVDGEVGKLEAAFFWIERTVLQHQFDFRRIRLLLLAALDRLLQA